MKNQIFFFFLLLVSLFCYAQSATTDSLLNLLKTEPQDNHAFIYNELSSILFDKEEFKESEGMAKQALKIAQKYDNHKEQFKALANLSYIYYHFGEIDTSIFIANEALVIAEKSGEIILKARIYNHLGNAYSKISEFDKSLHYFLESLKIVEDSLPDLSPEQSQFYKSLLFNNIGTVYIDMGQGDFGLPYFQQSLAIRRQQNNADGIASCLQNIGVIYENNKQYDSTIILYNEALEIRKSLNQQGFMAELLMNLGAVYIKMHRYKLSEEKLKDAIQIFKALENKRLLSYSYLILAELYMDMNLGEDAFPLLLKSIQISEQYHYYDFERDAYDLLSKYYISKGDYKLAWENLNKRVELSDSVFTDEMTTRVAEIQARYNTDKMGKEIEILSKDNEIKNLKVKRKSTQVFILAIVAFLFVLLIVVMLLLLNRKRLKQKQINTELEKSKLLENKLKEENAYQSKQLTTHALNMLQKNKLLQELDSELRSFAPRADDALKKKLSDIRRQINRNMNSEKDWDLFKLYFEEVNKDFFSSLHMQSDELTTGDMKLAAMIKLNLNIKEAAAVLNISPDSLRKARYRLRRKLGLLDRENLTDFLQRIS
jgi:tetratricopeptide (TPR) repeat protein